VWFAQAEAQFFLTGISSEMATFYCVISQLDHRYATEVEDIITSPPERDPYTTLRTELVSRLSPSREQRIHQLLTLEEMGDRKPSQFLRYLRSIAPDVSDELIRSIWSSHLPANVQAILAGQTEGNLKAAARCADRIYEVAPQPVLASVAPNHNSTALLQGIEDYPARRPHSAPSRTAFVKTSETLGPAPGSRAPAYTLNGTDRGNNLHLPAATAPAIAPPATPPLQLHTSVTIFIFSLASISERPFPREGGVM
jgi:hypothetical protein